MFLFSWRLGNPGRYCELMCENRFLFKIIVNAYLDNRNIVMLANESLHGTYCGKLVLL